MVVFKCLVLFVILFCIQGTYSKPPYDEQAEASGLGSTLWGWVSYLNPWGLSVDTSAPPKLEQGINSIQIKAKSVVKARQLTAATIPINITAQEPTSDKSLERKVTTPIISVQISTTTEPKAKHFLKPKASITVKTASENNPPAIKYSWKPLASTTPTAFVVDNPPQTTEETTSEQHVDPDAMDQEILTIKHPVTDDFSDPKASTIYITSDLDNPTTTEESDTEQLLEPESSNHIFALNTSIIKEETTEDLLEVTQTEEPATEPPLEVTTMSILPDIDNPIIVAEPLESEAPALNSHTVPNYKLERELSTPSSVMILDFPTSTEEIAIEQPLGPELSTTALALNDETTEVTTTDDHLEPETATTFTAIDQNNTTITVEISTEYSLTSEVTAAEEHTLGVEVPTEAVSIATLSTNIEVTVFSGLNVTYMGADKPLITTELDVDPYTRPHEVIFIPIEGLPVLTDPEITGSVSDLYPGANALPERVDEESTQTNEASILTEFGTDPYTHVTVAVLGTDEESPEISKASIPTELVMDPYLRLLRVASAVSERDKDCTERSEGSVLTETVTNPYPGIAVVVSEREKEYTEGGEAILAALARNSYITGIEEVSRVSISTERASNQFLVEETISTGAKVLMAVRVDPMLKAANEAMFTEKDKVMEVSRISRSRSAGFQLSFNHFRSMLLLYAVFVV